MARASSPRNAALDSFDRAILRIVQRDNKTPQRTIAEAVNLSTAAVQRRIAAMEDAGVIERNVAIANTKALQMGITAIVEVQLINERTATVKAAKKAFQDAPEVQQIYYVTGGISFVLVIVSRDMETYEASTQRLFNENEAVASFRSLLALDRVKFGTEVIVPEL